MRFALRCIKLHSVANPPSENIRERTLARSVTKQKIPPEPAKTMDDIAALAGVSKPTVSRALADSALVATDTKERIVEIARAHGYYANRNAQKLRGKRTNTVAVAVDFPALAGRRISDPFHFELLADVVKALGVRDQDVLLCAPKLDEERGYEELIAARSADGVIFLGQGSRESYLRDLARSKVPFVVWGAVEEDAPYCSVGSDNAYGGWLVGQRFAELSRKRVLFVGAKGHREFKLRRAGLEKGLREAGSRASVIDLETQDLSFENNYNLTRNWFSGRERVADAVFAASDTTAMAVMSVLRERQLRIPDDVSVVGYNDIPFASHLSPALTTVRQNTSQAGALLVEKLMQRLEGLRPRSTVLPTELIVRAS